MASSDDIIDEEPESDVKMTIWEHIGELRKRLVRCAIALMIGTGVCWTFRDKLLGWITIPYAAAWRDRFPDLVKLGQQPELQTLAPADAFVNYMQLALVSGAIVTIPVIFYQLWSFVSPGLYAREKRYIFPFVFFSTALFMSGVAFAFYVAMPFSFPFFFSLLGQVGGNTGIVLTSKPTMEFYLDFAENMLLAFGVAFELPLFIGFLSLAGIVTPQQLVKFSRYAILVAFIVGAVVTPGPEVSSQIAVSGALIILYFISVGVAFLIARKRADSEES